MLHRQTGEWVSVAADEWRRREHIRQRIGDGKTWHTIVRNTVPVDADGTSRGGRVD